MSTYDVFLSYSTADKPAVETLARKLRDEIDLNVFLDHWELVPGSQWQQALEEALAASRTCAVFIGPKGLGPWHNAEMRSALGQRMEEEPKRVIPVLLPGAQEAAVPDFLGQRTWVDLRAGFDDEGAFRRLVAGIQGVPPGTEVPSDSAERARANAGTRGRKPEHNKGVTWWRQRALTVKMGGLVGVLGVLLTVMAWCFPPEPTTIRSPDLYAVRVQILDPDGRPAEGAMVRVSSGNEPHLLPDGWWQVEIPAVKVPVSGQVTLWAEHSRWKSGRAILQLSADPNPSAEIRLEVPEERILGVVTNAEGRSVAGARIIARNHTAAAAVTDGDGKFELSVAAAKDQNVRLHIEHAKFLPKDTFCLAGSHGCSVVLSAR